MKRIFTFTAAAVFTLACASAQAQDLEAISGSASQANNTAVQTTASGAIASGGQVVMPQPLAKQTLRQEGSATLKTAPSLGSLALGGSHPCQWSPFTGQISIVGGALGGGGGEIDGACMLLVMAAASGDAEAYEAAKYMLAARDAATCEAMYKAGMVADCVDKKGRSRVKAQQQPVLSSNSGATRPVARPVSLDVECRKTGNKITPVVSKEVWDMYGREAVMNACR